MIRIDNHTALKSVNQLAKQLSEQELTRAMSRAINRTLSSERVQSRKIVRSKYNMPSDQVDNFSFFQANPKFLHGELKASSKAIPLQRFNPTFTTGSYSAKITRKKVDGKIVTTKKIGRGNTKTTGVTLSIIKGQKTTLPYAFITKAGAKPVFARGMYSGKGFAFGKSRLPITKLQTLSLYQAIAGQKSRAELNAHALKTYDKVFLAEVKYRVSKATKNV